MPGKRSRQDHRAIRAGLRRRRRGRRRRRRRDHGGDDRCRSTAPQQVETQSNVPRRLPRLRGQESCPTKYRARRAHRTSSFRPIVAPDERMAVEDVEHVRSQLCIAAGYPEPNGSWRGTTVELLVPVRLVAVPRGEEHLWPGTGGGPTRSSAGSSRSRSCTDRTRRVGIVRVDTQAADPHPATERAGSHRA